MAAIQISRRELITGGALAAGAALLPISESANASAPASFSFVHLTDMHIQPELGATVGVHKAFDAIRALKDKPAFGLVGGDLVMDASMVPRPRADLVYDLWRKEAEHLNLPLHYSVGNHDIYGLNVDGKPATTDPDYGKGLWKKRTGVDRTYSTFDHAGWRFIILDSAGITPDYRWEGNLDAEQLTWLDNLLRNTPTKMPIAVLTHYPICTAITQYIVGTTAAPTPGDIVKNGKVFREMIQKHNVKAVFQGHTHIVEEINYLGVRYITGGAICGNWWKGPRLGVHPEGFVVVHVSGNDFTWNYVPYGWRALPT